MKHIIIILISTTLLQIAQAGVISGGGGNSTGPMTIKQINKAIMDSKPLIRMILNREKALYKKLSHKQKNESLYNNLFINDFEIESYLKRLNINVNTDKPCLDMEGNIKDGSYDNSTPNEICISSFNLSKKLIWYNHEHEIAALIMHEIAHRFNMNEENSTKIQTDIIRKLRYKNIDFIKKRNIQLSKEADSIVTLTDLTELKREIKSLKKLAKDKAITNEKMLVFIKALSSYIKDINMKKIGGGFFAGLPIDMINFYHKELSTLEDGVAQLLHVSAINFETLEELKRLTSIHLNHYMFLKQHDPTKTDKERGIAKHEYDKVFLRVSGGQKISLGSFWTRISNTDAQNYFLTTTKDYTEKVISKFNTSEEMYRNLDFNKISETIEKAQEEIKRLSQNKFEIHTH